MNVVPLDDVLPLLEADVPLPVLPVADHDCCLMMYCFHLSEMFPLTTQASVQVLPLTTGVAITLGVDTTATDGAGEHLYFVSAVDVRHKMYTPIPATRWNTNCTDKHNTCVTAPLRRQFKFQTTVVSYPPSFLYLFTAVFFHYHHKFHHLLNFLVLQLSFCYH